MKHFQQQKGLQTTMVVLGNYTLEILKHKI